MRYDGAGKLLDMHALLATQLELVAICPEQGAGLGVPRPPVQLVEANGELRALGRDDKTLDVTEALHHFAAQSLPSLMRDHRLCGYIWKSRSPSCGFGSTPVFDRAGTPTDYRSGIHAAHFQRHLPYLSYVDETDLTTATATLAFILRCRLVFDIMYATAAPLRELHRHYAFLRAQFSADERHTLEEINAGEAKSEYLTALLRGCRQMPENELLELFIE